MVVGLELEWGEVSRSYRDDHSRRGMNKIDAGEHGMGKNQRTRISCVDMYRNDL